MIEYDADWQEKYRDMIMTPKKALSKIRSGYRVFLGTGCGVPTVLVDALVKNSRNLADVEILEFLTKGDAPYAESSCADSFKVNSFFIGENVRQMYQEGRGDYTPMLMFDIPALLKSGQMPLDVALIQVSPPDRRGKMSLGISVDIVKSATENASLVIAQVNPQMPWTRGDSLIDIYDLDILVPADVALLERLPSEVSEVTEKIAQLVSALVPDGATLEFGVGRIPGFGCIPLAVTSFLKEKKDLGIHTEMISDEIMELVEAGVVTGKQKGGRPGQGDRQFLHGQPKTLRLHRRQSRCFLFDRPNMSMMPM
jgi:acyl-CoA hydrolase